MKSLLFLPALLVAASLPMTTPVVTEGLAPQPLRGNDWVIDSGHSSCVFRVKHANASWFLGTFDQVGGMVTLDPSNAANSKVELTIPVASIDSNNKDRDDHLKGPDFFSAKENPDLKFVSSKITARGDDLEVAGKLSMAGKTNPITLTVKHVGDGEFRGLRRGYITEFSIKRSDFGMTYGVGKKTLGDDVHMIVSLELVQPK